jgi:hypothetical protein
MGHAARKCINRQIVKQAMASIGADNDGATNAHAATDSDAADGEAVMR